MKIVVINEGVDFRDFSQQVINAVEKGLDIVALAAQIDLLSPTNNWEHKPNIQVTSEPLKREVSTSDVPYVWVNEGVLGKTILPKRAKRLRFGVPFSPKTSRFGALEPQAGGYESEIIYAKKVDWPGIVGRHWDDTVAAKYEEQAAEIIQAKINEIS